MSVLDGIVGPVKPPHRPTEPREEGPTMIDPMTELRVRQEISERVARAQQRRLVARRRAVRRQTISPQI